MLKEYEEKREFSRTPEPLPRISKGEGPLRFVVHKHAARRLHFDLRLELDGALKSWAVPGGPSLDPDKKHLAVMVEDHPLEYGGFEGVIPAGEYGAGEVIIWDSGTYSPEHKGEIYFDERERAEALMREGLAAGKISFFLRGKRLSGSWTLVKTRRGAGDWLLIKHRDEFARAGEDNLADDSSAVSGVTIPDLRAGGRPGPAEPDFLPDIPGARRAPMPAWIAPMLAALTDAPFSDPGWLFEPKLDGFRSIAVIRKGEVRLLSRRGLDMTATFRDLAEGLRRQPLNEAIFDGEIVALDTAGRVCFQCLQKFTGFTVEPAARHAEGPASILYYAFDILYLDGYELTGVPLHRRKEILGVVLKPGGNVRGVDYFEKEGRAVYEGSLRQGLEGVIAKKRESLYEPGRRSMNWLKIKASLSEDFIIGGYTRGTGSRAHTFGALAVGYHDEQGRLMYAGHVGSGFSDADLADIKRRLEPLNTDTCPFLGLPPGSPPTTWVRPELVAEIRFAQWTHGNYLRAPVFRRLREDKPPAEVDTSSVVAAPRRGDPKPEANTPPQALDKVLKDLENPADEFNISVDGYTLSLNNVNKEFWPATAEHRALTKRDLLIYLARVSPYMLPHVKDRPLTLNRFPDGIRGDHFYQKHWSYAVPEFLATVPIPERPDGAEGIEEYLMCNNLASLLWLGQIADIETHTWFSRMSPTPDLLAKPRATAPLDKSADFLADYPDFIVFDLDPYLYSGKEPRGAEPDLNRAAFAMGVQVACWLKELLDMLNMSSFIKTSGRTGIHVFVPILRRFDYAAVRDVAENIGNYLLRQHPAEITTDWAVEKRTGKVFIDYNQNVRGKTVASVYSARISPEASVSAAVAWDELKGIYPADLTILNVPDRLERTGDLWSGILEAKKDLSALLEVKAWT